MDVPEQCCLCSLRWKMHLVASMDALEQCCLRQR
jgi:hypothetical protein